MNYTVLLKQHIGAPCTPVVKAGDKIARGQLIAEATGLGSPIHSPFNGMVSSIEENAIIIDADKNQTEDFIKLDGQDDRSLLAESGLVGMGGAGFPTHVKCNIDLKGGCILVNAAECEPFLEHNIRYLEKDAPKIIEGIKLVKHICNAKEAVIAIKAKHERAVEVIDRLCAGEEGIRYYLLPNIYPVGEERAVVREVLGKLLATTELPSVAGAVVINVETVQRLAEAVIDRRPVITKNISVAGKLKGGVHTRVFYDVPVGTTVRELIERAGGIDGEYGEIILGGPFTGHAVSLDTPITKTSGGIIVTQPFPDLKKAKTGILICACGGNEDRMRDIAKKMNAEVVLVQTCKQAVENKGTYKCENPGNCPGQAQKCMNVKKAGCTHIIIGNCSDCTNTVMGSAPKLGLQVHHQTDHVFDTMGVERMRYLNVPKTVPQPGELSIEQGREGENSLKGFEYKISREVNGGVLVIEIKEGKDIEIELPLSL